MSAKTDKQKELARLEAVMEWALKSEAAARINAALDLARSEPGIPILPEEMDRDPWLLNCPNGTLELKTATLREHRREDYLTKLCPTEYHPDAICPLWEQVVNVMFDRKMKLIRYVQKVLGMALTGDVSEQCFFIFWGAGANGKSTLINAFLAILGEHYAIKAPRDLFLARKLDNHPTQMARLFGRRLVVCVESHSGARLDESLIKELTGGDPITARRMREDPWQFNPTHKAILVTNHKPEIRGTDEGIWRRQRLVPFTVRIPDDRQDKELPQKLAAEYLGILAWCVQGCLAWQQEGLEPPDEVRAATKEYRVSQDTLSAFIAECCLTGPDYRCKARELYAAYCQWCEATGEEKTPQRRFGEALTEKGVERYTNNGTWYRGLAVRPPSDADEAE